MPRLPDVIIPKYRRHRPSGQAVVTLNGRDFYLGMHGSPASKVEYDRRIAEWIAAGRKQKVDPKLITVGEIALAFIKHAKTYYRSADGSPTGELDRIMRELRPLTRLYHHTPAADFDSLRLEAVRNAMIGEGWARSSVNHAVNTIKRCFKYAASRKLIEGSVFRDLETLEALKAGRSEAPEPKKVKPVPLAHVEAVISHVLPTIAAMIRVQGLTGMRSTELCSMKGIDLDMSGKLWIYTPGKHKTEYLGHERIIIVGPRAQAIIKPFLKADVNAFLFSPADAVNAQLDQRTAKRVTPQSTGNVPGVRRRTYQLRYTKDSYAKAIVRGCEKAWPPPAPLAKREDESSKEWKERLTPKQAKELKAWQQQHRWHPHQIRHAYATTIRKEHGADASLIMLGDRSESMLAVYAERDREAAMKIALMMG